MGYRGKLSVLAAGLVFASCSHANVVYNWTQTSSADYVETYAGQIIVTDAAYRSGGVNVFYNTQTPRPDGFTINNSPIIKASLSFHLRDEPTPGSFSGANENVSAEPREPRFTAIQKTLKTDLTFTEDGLLSGNLDIFGESANFDSAGSGLSWLVSDVNSDYFFDRCNGSSDTPCSGGTGYWMVDASTIPTDVPEPAGWALFGLALTGTAGICFSRRRNGLGGAGV